jgi:Nitrile hydratase beta subunit
MIAFDERTSLLLRPVNDIAGLPGTALNLSEHPMLPWEKRCHALLESLNARGVVTMEEKRRGVEELGKTIYAALTYYEKWIMSAANHLLAKGHLTSDELAKKLHQVRERFE